MRIVAGEFRSRVIQSVPGENTRPTSDKVKGAVFSSLGNLFDGGRFLDCYSGTGNMAFEALSRGMDHAVLVEKDRRAMQVIKENQKELGVEERCTLYQRDIFSVIPMLSEPFDLVYIDPPYRLEKNRELLECLETNDLVKDRGIVAIESTAQETWPERCGSLFRYKEKTYRNTKITYYRKEKL